MSGSDFLWCALFLLGGVVLWLGLEQVSKAHPPLGWDLILLHRMDTVQTAPESIEILAIGNSHAGAIGSETLESQSLILPFPWNDLADMNYQVRTLTPRLPELRVVLITLSYFSFHWSNDLLDDHGLLDSRRKFHAVSPGWKPVEGDVESLVRGKSYWIVRPDDWLGVLQGLRERRDMEMDELEEHLEEVRTDSFLVAHAEDRVPHTLDQQREMMELDPTLPEENHDRLVGMIEYLQERDVCVVLYTPPFHWRYRELYRAVLQSEMHRLTRNTATAMDVPWLDFSEHPMADEARWFVDSDHLNAQGKSVFTEMLMDEVEERCPAFPD